MKPSINIKYLWGLFSVVLVLLLCLSSCVGTDNTSTTTTLSVNNATTGSIGFEFAWQNIGPAPAPSLAPQFDECVDYGVDEFVALVYDSSNNLVKGAVWPCASHQKNISGIKQGVNNKIEVQARKSGNVLWSGQKSGLIVIANATVNAGTVMMTYVGSDFTKPTITSITPQSGLTNVPVTVQLNAVMSEPLAISTVNSISFTLSAGATPIGGTVSYISNTATATFTPATNLSYSTTYAASLTNAVTDMAGNRLASTYSWSFTTEPAPIMTPPAPSGVSATAGDSSVTVSWSPTTGATGYNIYWSTSSGVTNLSGTKIANAASPYVHTGRTNGLTFYYVVSAYNSYGEGSASFQVSATPADTTPPDTYIISTPSALSNSSSASFQFTATESNCSFECKLDSLSYTSCTSPATYTGLVNGTHTFVVRAKDSSLNIDPSPASFSWTVDLSPSVPGIVNAPTGVTATSGDQKVTITWGQVPGATAYNLYWSTTPGVSKATGSRIATVVSPYVHTNRVNGTTYYYVATAQKGADESADSIQVSATPKELTPPETTISSFPPIKSNSLNASFSFEANEASIFECIMDTGAFSTCASPAVYTGLSEGSHTFYVRSTDLSGNVDATPASYSWSIDTVAPTLVSSNPSYGATNISFSNSISVVFSEAVDASTVNTTTFDVRDGSGTKVNGILQSSNPTFIFAPSNQMNLSETYTVTVSSGVKDTFGNSFVGAVWTFTTVSTAVWPGPIMFGSTVEDVGHGVGTDSLGNFYVFGDTFGGLDGSVATGKRKLFLTKYSSAGGRQWLVQFGNANDACAFSMAVDASGNSYLLAQVIGDFDGNAGMGGYDFVIIKFDSSGNKQWSKLYGGTANDVPSDIKLDSSGNIFVAGVTSGSFYSGTVSGSVVMKLDNTGNMLWTKQVIASSGATPSIAIDRDDNIIVGTFDGMYKYNQNGDIAWHQSFVSYTVATDPSGNIYIPSLRVGCSSGMPSPGIVHSATNYPCTFYISLLQIDSTGVVSWQSAEAEFGFTYLSYYTTYDFRAAHFKVLTDTIGNVYISSIGDTNHIVVNNVYGNIFYGFSPNYNMYKYDTSGTYKWSKSLFDGSSISFGATLDPTSGDMIVTGYTKGTFGTNLNNGAEDVLIFRVNSDGTMFAPGVKKKLQK